MITRSARRPVALLALGSLALLAACGGDDPDDAGASTSSEAATSSDETSEPVPDEPTTDASTTEETEEEESVDPRIPEEMRQAIGPMEAVGQPLPALDTPDPAADPAVGTPAPVLHGESFEGKPLSVDAKAQGPTMVVFLAHWCPHCNAEIPVLNELRDSGRLPADLTVIGVSTSPSPDAPNFPPAQWLDDMDWTWPAMPDGVAFDAAGAPSWVAADAYGLTAFPFMTVIDEDGNVASRWTGEKSADEIVELVESALGR